MLSFMYQDIKELYQLCVHVYRNAS